MKILRRTNGIDIKAKSGALVGHVELKLLDDTTGKVIEKIEKKNFFTKALDSALNDCPFGLNSIMKMGQGVNYDSNTEYKIKNIYQSILGGVILFPSSLGDSVDDYFPSFASNYPTAYASQASYQLDDPRQGQFDGVSSGKITGGYRFVYAWGSSGGNGTISAIALSHVDCFRYFNDPIQMLFPHFSDNNSDNPKGYFGYVSNTANFNGAVAINDKGIICLNADSAIKKLRMFNTRPYDFQLTGNTDANYDPATAEPVWELDLSSYTGTPSYQSIGNFLYAFFKNSNGTSATTIVKINLDTGLVVDTQNITWTAPQMTKAEYGFCIKDGYLYAGATVAGKIYKCSLSNAADVTEIACNAVVNEALCATDGSDNIYGTNILINNGVVVDYLRASPNINSNASAWGGSRIIYEHGVWMVTAGRAYNRNIGAQMKAPYCATKANLQSAVTKTADKQMVVQYSVTQV